MAKANTRAGRARTRTQNAENPDTQPSTPDGDTLLPDLAAEVAAVMTAEASQPIADPAPGSETPTSGSEEHEPEQAEQPERSGLPPVDDAPWTPGIARGGRFGRVGQTMIDRGLVTMDQLDDRARTPACDRPASGRHVGRDRRHSR